MYSKISDSLVLLADGIVMAGMSDNDAKKTLMDMTPDTAKALAEALKGLKSQIEQGKPIMVTAAIGGPAKALLLALMTLAPAVFADPAAVETMAAKLRTAPINMEQVMKINETAEKNVQNENAKKIDNLKTMVTEKGDEGVASQMVFQVGDKKFMAANKRQEKVLQTLANMARGFAMHRSQGIITPEQYKGLMEQAVKTLASGGIRPMGHEAA
jgi:hypothetical protein